MFNKAMLMGASLAGITAKMSFENFNQQQMFHTFKTSIGGGGFRIPPDQRLEGQGRYKTKDRGRSFLFHGTQVINHRP